MKDFEITRKGKIGKIAKVDGANARVYWSYDNSDNYQQVSNDWINQNNPQPDGYVAFYENGTTEYIPPHVYERDFMTDEEKREREEAAKDPNAKDHTQQVFLSDSERKAKENKDQQQSQQVKDQKAADNKDNVYGLNQKA